MIETLAINYSQGIHSPCNTLAASSTRAEGRNWVVKPEPVRVAAIQEEAAFHDNQRLGGALHLVVNTNKYDRIRFIDSRLVSATLGRGGRAGRALQSGVRHAVERLQVFPLYRPPYREPQLRHHARTAASSVAKRLLPYGQQSLHKAETIRTDRL